MKLFYSQNSPYARIARISVLEAGLGDEVEHIKVVNRGPESPLLEYNPTGRVPTLVDGTLVLAESRHICAYLDYKKGTTRFFDPEIADWHSIGLESVVVGFLDGLVHWLREIRRLESARSNDRIDSERRRALRCLDYLSAGIESEPEHFQRWDYTCISLACALGLLDFNEFLPGWKPEHAAPARWFLAQAMRSSMRETSPR